MSKQGISASVYIITATEMHPGDNEAPLGNLISAMWAPLASAFRASTVSSPLKQLRLCTCVRHDIAGTDRAAREHVPAHPGSRRAPTRPW